MILTIAKTAGFCFGVNRAVNIVYDLSKKEKNVFTLGPIIHNPQVVGDLLDKGVNILDNVDQCSPDGLVVIRSHGVSKEVYKTLDAKNIPFVDATCPFVSKIHKIVSKMSKEGYTALIAGDKTHPEIIGIIGHCSGDYLTFKNYEEFMKIMDNNHKKINDNKYILVSQTTFNVGTWNKCVEIAKKLYTNIEIFDTICSATSERQSEAISLAKESDLMIIIGGKNSSNTAKLKEVCSDFCETMLIEEACDIYKSSILSFNKIGITAGASTPAYVIEEVLKTMEEILNNNSEECSFADLLEQSINERLFNGKRVKGVVTSLSLNEIQVDVGAKQSGFVPISELTDDPNLKVSDIVKKGDEIDLIVLKVNDQEGTVMLSKKRCDSEIGFELIEKAYEEQLVLEGTVINVVKGGILVLVNNVKIFVPASQSCDRRIENLEVLLKTNVSLKIIEIKEKNRRAVGSVRQVLKEKRDIEQEKLWKEIEKDKVYAGKVRSLTSYGAFIDIGGIDGMLHISEISWKKLKHPSDVLKEDEIIEVYIKSFDEEKKKVSLGYKKMEDNPWEIFKRDYQHGDVVEAKIASITTFGAFAEILPGVDGLIHISQICNKRIDKISDVLSVNQHIKAQIIELDLDKKRISLSMRALISDDISSELEEE